MNQYFAKAPRDEIANEIKNKFEEHLRWLEDTDQTRRIQTLYDTFYNFEGLDLELTQDRSTAYLSVNHFRNLVERLQSLVCQAKLNFVPKAVNSDSDSQIQADFSKGLLEYYATEKGMNGHTFHQVLQALVMLKGYIFAPWDYKIGKETLAGRDGDQAFHNLSVFDVATHPSERQTPYYIVKIRENKWDLAALYGADNPELAEKIMQLSPDSFDKRRLETPFTRAKSESATCDEVDVYYFFHERTVAVKKGRETAIVGDEVLYDRALKYKTIPIVTLCPSKILSSTGSDSPATLLVGLQTTADKLWSAVSTNNLACARQSIWSPSDVEAVEISKGLRQLKSAQEPKAVQLTQSAPETYKLIESYQNQQETLSGINATVRGNPGASVGTAGGQALMLAQAIEYAAPLQEAYAQSCGELGTIVIHNLQVFCTEEKIAYIGGTSKKSYAKTFKAAAVSQINHVIVDLGSPMTQTVTGRYTLAQEMVQQGILKDPKALVEFLRSGQLDSLTEDDFADAMLIRTENEELRKGERPIVSLMDIHPSHILKHKAIADDPAVRYNPAAMKNLNDHVQDHIDVMRTVPPDLWAILTGQPLPPPPPPPPPDQDQVQPEIQGQPLPNIPEGAPPMAAEAYGQAVEPFMMQG